MTDTGLTTQQIAAQSRSAPGRITGKLKVALDAMIWEGLDHQEAAQKANLTTRAVRLALERPHGKAYYMRQLDVLRTSERARNIHALVEVRAQKSNHMARVQAAKAIEQISDVESTPGRAMQQAPGFCINVITVGGQTPHLVLDAAKPLIEHEPVPMDDTEQAD